MGNKEFDFMSRVKTFIIIPCVLFAASLIVFAIAGLEVAIEFKGGTLLTYSYSGELELSSVENLIGSMNYGDVGVTRGSAIGGTTETFTVSFASNEGLTADVQRDISAQIVETFSENSVELVNGQDVSPSIGSSFFLKCLVAVLVSFIFLIVYIAFRFSKIGGWSAGVFALVALLVDLMVVFATFVFFRFSIDSNFMAVALTVLGYSINNTIVIYDRIRENRNIYGKKLTISELVNKSVNQSISRSVNTTVATGIAVIAICIVSIAFGVPSIVTFAFPMLMGIASGLFTSLCLSAVLWAVWKERQAKNTVTAK